MINTEIPFMRKTLNIICAVTFASAFVACSGNKAKIHGAFCDIKNDTIVLERIEGSRLVFVDSVKTGSDGSFSTKYEFTDKTPVFLNMRHGNDYVTLLIEPKENVEIVSIINMSQNYTVKGSKGSEQVKMLNRSLINTSNTIDSLYDIYNGTSSPEMRDQLLQQINKIYIDHKRSNIEFIMNNPASFASMLALYQQMPNGINVFGNKNDIQYFRMVKDSLHSRYPASAYVLAMGRDIKDQENRNTLDMMIRNSIMNRDINAIPDIELSDIYGKTHKISDLRGKVILLSFWSYTLPNSALINAEMREIYNDANDKGLEIYQVSLDDDKAAWVSSVANQNIPWISVRDPHGSQSIAARNYNVSSLPANFLIDRNGNIVGKNVWGQDLVNKINQLTR